MSEFEYLRNISIGQYFPLGSFIHKLDPRAKLIGLSLLVLSLTLTNELIGIGIALIFIIFLLHLSKMPGNYALRGLLAPLPFMLILAVVQIFITPHENNSLPVIEIFGLVVFPEGVRAAVQLLMKFAGLIILISISSATISTLEMIHGLDLLMTPLNRIGLKTDTAAMTLQVTLRFIPFLAINAERIAKSQASRGAEWGRGKMRLFRRIRQIIPLIIPLFNGSLRQAETLVEAMLARGYGESKTKTSMVEYLFGRKDLFFLLVCFAISFLILFPVLIT